MPSLIPLPGEPGYSALPKLATMTLDDYVLQTAWDSSGQWFAAMPSNGSILIGNADGQEITRLPGHANGNGSLAWQPGGRMLATSGQDGEVRLYAAPCKQQPRVVTLGSGWTERLAWNCDGSLLAVALRRTVHVLDGETGEQRCSWPNQKSTVADLAWNPCNPLELASVCNGGARLWRVGKTNPFGGFYWSGASMVVTWSPDGRMVVTGDQTPSIHIHDLHAEGQHTPLHIDGFETKVKDFAWLRGGAQVAVGGGRVITLLPCRGKDEPDGTKPARLDAHLVEITSLQAASKSDRLLSAARDGGVLLWTPQESENPDLLAVVDEEISSLCLSPTDDRFLLGTHGGTLTLYLMPLEPSTRPTEDL